MMLVITGVGGLIHLFSVGYMGNDPGYARYFAYLNLFVAFMLVLVLGASLPVSFIGWEGVGLCSYLLIGFWFDVERQLRRRQEGVPGQPDRRLRRADRDVPALVAPRHARLSPTSPSSAPLRLVAGGGTVGSITLLIFLGCTGKSAQIPLYVWLPDAMAGPTPVSALIHAATMVTAGVFLVARMGVLFALAPGTLEVVAVIGAVTAFFAASIGLRQYDIKKVLAYSTVSQLGYMFLGVGTGVVRRRASSTWSRTPSSRRCCSSAPAA